jgi:Domain of unknown function (DUF4159)
MRKLFGMLMPLVVLSGVLLVAQEGLDYEGNYADFRRLPPQTIQEHDFTFVRLMYNGRIPHYLKNWYTDYPTGDRNLVRILGRVTGIDVAPETRVIPVHHGDLFSYPMIYSSEAGQMVLDAADASTLREYLLRGGFWMIDDFWGSFEWKNFQHEIKKVFPDSEIVDVPLSHPIFHVFYDIDRPMQVPNIAYAYNPGTPTWEQDGFEPYVRGIFDSTGRLLVLINHNTDLMDASEWADDPLYPQRFAAYSYRVFSNAVVYAQSH